MKITITWSISLIQLLYQITYFVFYVSCSSFKDDFGLVLQVFCNFSGAQVKGGSMELFSKDGIKSYEEGTSNVRRVCYYAIPSVIIGQKYLLPEQIDPFLCTHVIVIGGGIIHDQSISTAHKYDVDFYRRIIGLKLINPLLKIMLCLTLGFQELVKNTTNIDVFAFNARQYILDFGFDGLDLDWEFPAWPIRIGNAEEKQRFSYLVIQLWNALKLASHPPLLLSVAVAGVKSIIKRSYEIGILVENVDFLNIMGYDYRIFWRYLPFTGYNAPLFKAKMERGYFATLNIKWSAIYWHKKGIPLHKLVIGIPIYGRTWKLLSFMWHGIGAPAVSEGVSGGAFSYPETLVFLEEGAQMVFDEQQKVPYAYMGRTWLSYENRHSIQEKVRWIKDHGFAGVMTWSLNHDDYEGIKSGRKFDLHHVILEVLNCS